MGPWSYMLERFNLKKLEVRSRKYYAVPAAGSSARFKLRQRKVIESVFNDD
jgi:2-oxoglutarate dehydrogenase E1 component